MLRWFLRETWNVKRKTWNVKGKKNIFGLLLRERGEGSFYCELAWWERGECSKNKMADHTCFHPTHTYLKHFSLVSNISARRSASLPNERTNEQTNERTYIFQSNFFSQMFLYLTNLNLPVTKWILTMTGDWGTISASHVVLGD